MIRLKLFVRVISLSFLIACNSGLVSGNETNKRSSTNQTVQEPTAVSLNTKDWKAGLRENPGKVIDVRTPEEWKTGFIDGAKFANLFDQDFVSQVNKIQAEKNKPLYIYCRSGNRSKEAMRILKENGYTQIYELNYGILGWQQDGFSITK